MLHFLRQGRQRGRIGFFPEAGFQATDTARLRALLCRQRTQFTRNSSFVVVKLRLQGLSGLNFRRDGGNARGFFLVQQPGSDFLQIAPIIGATHLRRQRAACLRFGGQRVTQRTAHILQSRRTGAGCWPANGDPVEFDKVAGILLVRQIQANTINVPCPRNITHRQGCHPIGIFRLSNNVSLRVIEVFAGRHPADLTRPDGFAGFTKAQHDETVRRTIDSQPARRGNVRIGGAVRRA